MAILQLHADRTRGGVECGGLGFEQPRAARDGDHEQALRQLHRIGIGGAGRDERAGARNAEMFQQHGVVEECARQVRALSKRMLLDQLLAGGPGGKIERILVAHVAGNA